MPVGKAARAALRVPSGAATMMCGGPPRIEAWEPGQIGNEAAITKYLKCRGQARHTVASARALGDRVAGDCCVIRARRRTLAVLGRRVRRPIGVNCAGSYRGRRKFFMSIDVNDNSAD